ncbi:MAG TPA: hypothetical protein VHH10_05435 [Rubrobacteraceae bacterium]|nr:hypothetical protein [Rubrobacteraceae bacterium]
MAATENETTQPNLFELAGEYTQITYSTTSLTGQPQFSYRDQQRDVNVTGDDIRSQDTELGALVTVTLEVNPDRHTLTVTLLVPQINLRGGTESRLSTLAVLTTHRTSIGGPGLVEGPLQTYEAVALEGTARLVQF